MIDYLEIIKKIRQHIKDFMPEFALVLGSGLGGVSDDIEKKIIIPYSDIPFFPIGNVVGHDNQLIFGFLMGVPVVCLKGRVHLYEGTDISKIKVIIRTLKLLGCSKLILTNAAGSLRKNVGAGEICIINDHINMYSFNPLIGPNDDAFGPRFFPMTNAYDSDLIEFIKKIAKKSNIEIHEGVYAYFTGPCFETPAEINAFRNLGADLVGMSTVQETIVARHSNMKVLAISAITNLAAGMSSEHLSHEGTIEYANITSIKLKKLIYNFLKEYKNEI